MTVHNKLLDHAYEVSWLLLML